MKFQVFLKMLKDLLSVLAMQNSNQTRGLDAINHNLNQLLTAQENVTAAVTASVPPIDKRPRTLLTLAIIALCWIGLWSAVPSLADRRNRNSLSVVSTDGAVTAEGTTPSTNLPSPAAPWNAPSTASSEPPTA